MAIDTDERVLAPMRIFQAVFNDLHMRHEIVTLEDGTKQYAYVYDGVDPYALEDSAFPLTVKLIKAQKHSNTQELTRTPGDDDWEEER